MESFIKLSNVKKTYAIGEQKFNALDGINLNINQGEFVVILGPPEFCSLNLKKSLFFVENRLFFLFEVWYIYISI